ncbi:hypothetical protein ACFZAE_26720 [Streptomyces scabiei]|uniref:hypothetical protein n=1 Tax=Streptomyces scabiei TaxID=1930 RepID=UPI0036E37064
MGEAGPVAHHSDLAGGAQVDDRQWLYRYTGEGVVALLAAKPVVVGGTFVRAVGGEAQDEVVGGFTGEPHDTEVAERGRPTGSPPSAAAASIVMGSAAVEASVPGPPDLSMITRIPRRTDRATAMRTLVGMVRSGCSTCSDTTLDAHSREVVWHAPGAAAYNSGRPVSCVFRRFSRS